MSHPGPGRRISRSLTALLTIGAWFCLSNHCVLGLESGLPETKAEMEAGACPMHKAPEKEKPAANPPCCKDLRALLAQMVKNAGARSGPIAVSPDFASPILLAPPCLSNEVEGLDTGPPVAFSFAESVLQQSLLAHAPPLS